MTKDELKEFYWTRRRIKQLEEKLFELDAAALKMRQELSSEPRTAQCKDTMASVVAAIVDTQREINDQLKKNYDTLRKILEAIAKLPVREGHLIHARYIELKDWEEIAVEMGYCWQHVHKVHSRALKLLA